MLHTSIISKRHRLTGFHLCENYTTTYTQILAMLIAQTNDSSDRKLNKVTWRQVKFTVNMKYTFRSLRVHTVESTSLIYFFINPSAVKCKHSFHFFIYSLLWPSFYFYIIPHSGVIHLHSSFTFTPPPQTGVLAFIVILHYPPPPPPAALLWSLGLHSSFTFTPLLWTLGLQSSLTFTSPPPLTVESRSSFYSRLTFYPPPPLLWSLGLHSSFTFKPTTVLESRSSF